MITSKKSVAKGDTLYVLHNYSSNKGPFPYVVESVGTKWINFEGSRRVSKDDLRGDHLHAYLSLADYENDLRLERLKRRIISKLQEYKSSTSVTPDQLDAIGEILGINGDLPAEKQ
jgi:hypothetical protein